METTIKRTRKPVIQIYALRGKFTGVTYFMTSMTLSEAAEQLHFASSDTAKSFDERVQRRIDEKRATKELFEQYLKQPGIRFFNSLVVVLTPKDGTQTGYFQFHPFEDPEGNSIGDVGMLEILTDIDRIVVDGQHRLHALRDADKYCRDADYNKDLHLEEIKVPVVFLTFDDLEGAGSIDKPVPDLPRSVAERSRRVFIDLNKNAKRVDKNTLLILDDHDFSAVAARYLIEQDEELELYTKWAELGGSGGTLGDRDPHFTNLQLLDEYVEKIFYLDSTLQVEGYEEIRNLTEKIEKDYTLSLAEERKEAIDKYFLQKLDLRDGLIPEQMIKGFFSEIVFFAEWKSEIRLILTGDPNKQPADTKMTTAQRKAVRELHREHLLATVAGQRTAFNAVLAAYAHFDEGSEEGNWHYALARMSKVHEHGLYSRNHMLWHDLLVRQGNRMRVNAIDQSSRILTHLVRGTDLDEVMEVMKDDVNPAEGYGTDETLRNYQEALDVLR